MAVALSELTRRFFDRMDEGASQYISQQQAIDVINEAYSLLWSEYVKCDGRYFETESIFTPVVNVRDYPLPANFRRLISIYAIPLPIGSVATGYHIPMQRSGRMQYQGGAPVSYAAFYDQPVPNYMLLGSNIRLDPTPVTAPNFAVALWYLAHYTPLVNTTDTLDPGIFPGHEQYIINQAVIQLKLGKEEQPAADLQAANAAILLSLKDELALRDSAQSVPVLDATGYDGWI